MPTVAHPQDAARHIPVRDRPVPRRSDPQRTHPVPFTPRPGRRTPGLRDVLAYFDALAPAELDARRAAVEATVERLLSAPAPGARSRVVDRLIAALDRADERGFDVDDEELPPTPLAGPPRWCVGDDADAEDGGGDEPGDHD